MSKEELERRILDNVGVDLEGDVYLQGEVMHPRME